MMLFPLGRENMPINEYPYDYFMLLLKIRPDVLFMIFYDQNYGRRDRSNQYMIQFQS